MTRKLTQTAVLALGLLTLSSLAAVAGELGDFVANSSAVGIATKANHDGATLTVSGPDGFEFRTEVGPGQHPTMDLFDSAGYGLPDGTYSWELRLNPAISESVRKTLAEAREAGNDWMAAELRAQGHLPAKAQVENGYFTVVNGSLVNETQEEAPTVQAGPQLKGALEGSPAALKAQVIADDLIVDGSACVGSDCTSGENFGFDTIRLKENNLRIKFDDTSSSGSFPNNDWQLVANDTNNGGANRFSIEDVTNNKTPFTVEANTPNNTLYTESDGDVGVGTSNPALRMHLVKGDSPGLRLEQDGSSGFTAHTWDISGNETNFFIRDVTSGSKLPFKIKPGAPNNALFVAADGDLGLGTDSPDSALHVRGSDGDTEIHMQETNATETARSMMNLENNGRVRFNLTDSSADGAIIRFLAGDNGLDVVHQGQGEIVRYLNNGGTGYTVGWELGQGSDRMTLDNSGNLTTLGTVNGSSDRNLKENFQPVSGEEILSKLSGIEITRWKYKADDGIEHIGPMAQDFYAAFGLGIDERHISTVDADGISLAAIKALNAKVEAKDELIRKLEERLTALEAQLP